MSPSQPPCSEATRLACLHQLHILDTVREPLFDSFVRMACEVCATPIVLLSLIDADRQWFKAEIGASVLPQAPRESLFCNYAIQSDDLMEVPDTHDDVRFAASRFVRDDPGVRFYAGAPLILPGGARVGTLCVMDTQARRLTEAQRRTLVELAAMAAQALTMRRELIDRVLSVRSEAQEALASREAELHDLYTNAPCGYYSLDEGGLFVRINDTALRWLGCTRDEAIGKLGIVDFLDAAGRQYFQARFPRLKRDGRIFAVEYDLIGRNGMRRRIVGSASAVYGPGGEFVMTRTAVHDISELHRAREKLQRLDAEQKSVIDTDLVGIVKLKDRCIVWANRGAEKIFGRAAAEVAGMSTRFFYADDAAWHDFAAAAVPSIAADGMYRSVQSLQHADGRMLSVDTSVSAMPGHPGEWLCVLVDITAIKRAEEIRVHANALEAENRQLLEAARVKSVFLSNMSHELYTPLNAIIGFAHLLGTGAIAPDSPRFAKYLGEIGASGQKLLAQLQAVLSFTDAETGRIDLRPQRVELREVLERVIDVARPECQVRNIGVALAAESESLSLVIDPMRLSQVVSQLLANAIRFSRAGGRVTLCAQAQGAHEFVVAVHDEGIGIAADQLPHLFSPFRQLSEGLARTHGGAGLGLALVRRIVQAQGGTVQVASTPGAGSVFTVTLPRVQGDGGLG